LTVKDQAYLQSIFLLDSIVVQPRFSSRICLHTLIRNLKCPGRSFKQSLSNRSIIIKADQSLIRRGYFACDNFLIIVHFVDLHVRRFVYVKNRA